MSVENENSSLDKVKFAYVHLPPFTERKTVNGELVLDGIMFSIVQSLAKWMNFEPIFIHEPNNLFGTFQNDTWNGIVGMVYNNEVDISLNPVLPSENTLDRIEYTNPIIIEKFCLLGGKEVQEPGIFLYFRALMPKVWAVIVVSLVVVALTIAAIYVRAQHTSECCLYFRIALEYIWVLFACMLQQSVSEKWMLSHSRRASKLAHCVSFLVMAWVMGIALLVMGAFRSELFSKLTIVKPVPLIDNLEDFTTKSNIEPRTPIDIEIHEILQGDAHDRRGHSGQVVQGHQAGIGPVRGLLREQDLCPDPEERVRGAGPVGGGDHGLHDHAAAGNLHLQVEGLGAELSQQDAFS